MSITNSRTSVGLKLHTYFYGVYLSLRPKKDHFPPLGRHLRVLSTQTLSFHCSAVHIPTLQTHLKGSYGPR